MPLKVICQPFPGKDDFLMILEYFYIPSQFKRLQSVHLLAVTKETTILPLAAPAQLKAVLQTACSLF